MIHCINCGHVNAEGASQCEACFEMLPALTSCPTCQAAVPDDAFFCPQCGASLPRGVAHQGQAESPLPPTDVVNLSNVEESVPPTNVVKVSDVAETMPPVQSPVELPPTNVVHPLPVESASDNEFPGHESQGYQTLETDQKPGQDEKESETVPTMVVSPGADREVVNAPQEPPKEPKDYPQVTPDLVNPPAVPPTVPPQTSPSFYSQTFPEPSGGVELPLETPSDELDDSLPTPPEESVASSPVMEPESPASASSEPEGVSATPATTMQPTSPAVGETIIQKPPARLIHERTDTVVTLPTNMDVILVGKTTSTLAPDIDVSGFVDSDVVSRRHAAIFADFNGYSIEDLGSSNGTYVNDVPCVQGDRIPINPGDRICLGRENKVSFIFQIG